MKEPFVFDIKRSSTFDGPGIRTVIFFKGCNLDCFWCHNPEGKNPEPELAFFEGKCTGCGACQVICTKAHDECSDCGKCQEVCAQGARRIFGRKYSITELVEIIKKDVEYFKITGGGVTFSGGECMLYPDYIAALASKCKELGISVAVDTAGSVPYSYFEKVLPHVDLFLYDIKTIDPILHKKGTGKDNKLILKNLDLLIKANKKLHIRVPVIPKFNDGEELLRIKSFCSERLLTVETLPYHEFGRDKKRALESSFKRINNI